MTMHPGTGLERLRHNLLFENIDDAMFETVKRQLKERRFCADEVIVEDESEGEELFLLLQGRVKIIKQTKAGEEKLLALLHAGDFFGELELVDARPRSARVVAIEDCIVYTFHKKHFDRLLEESHPFAVRLMQVLSLRLRSSNKHFILELERNSQRSRSEVQKLEQLIEASKVLNSTLRLDDLLNVILETALRIVDGDRGTVYLLDQKKQELWSKVLHGEEMVRIELPLGKGIAGYVGATGDTLNIADAYLDPRFNPEVDRKSGYRTKTILCMPMKNKEGDIIGVFQALNKRNGLFTSDDENFIAALSLHAAIAIEKARLYEEEKALLRMREEVRLAAKIQLDLLPKVFPKIPGYDIAGTSRPAQMVGGDYFDFIPVDEHRLAVCLGDVSGKGLPAALLMASTQATLRGQTLLGGSAKECIARANTLLFRSTPPEKFVTMFYGVLDTKSHRFTFSNAGHDHPMLLHPKRKDADRLKTGGIVLGIMEHFPYEEETIPIGEGDLFVVYTDGISESMNAAENQFGEERLLEVIRKYRDRPASEIIQKIVGAATAFAGTHPQYDDMTLVVVKRS